MKRITICATILFSINVCQAQWIENTDGTKITTPDHVGIITTNPDANLTIGGGDLITYNLKIKDQVGRALELVSPTQTSPIGRLKITDTNSSLRLGVRDYPDLLHFDGLSGRIGIGTTNPDKQLSVLGDVRFGTEGLGGGFHRNGILIQTNGTRTELRWQHFGQNTNPYIAVDPEVDAAKLLLGTNGEDRMVIKSNGNVGIGNLNPDANLTIGGGDLVTYNLKLKDQVGRAIELISPTQTSPYGRLKISSTVSDLRIGVNDFPDQLNIEGSNGFIGIGTTQPDSELTVNGTIHTKEVKVDLNIAAPDYVFEPGYELRTLQETKEYISKNKHLPEIPSAAEIDENGIDLGAMNMRLLKKIEELTLYQIELMEEMEKMKKELQELKSTE